MTDTFLKQLTKRVDLTPNAVAFRAPDYTNLDYTSLAGIFDEITTCLDSLGIGKGDLVAFVADREPATAIIALALVSHAVAVPLNPEYKQHEVESLFSRLPVKAVLIPAGQRYSFHETFENINLPVIEFNVDEWSININPVSNIDRAIAGESTHKLSEDISLFLQTSGSTATPRIVPLTQMNLLAAAENVNRSLSLTEEDICLNMLPLYHIGGFVDVLMAPLLSGGQVIFNRGFDTKVFFRLNEELTPTWTQTVPAMLQELVDIAGMMDGVENQLRFIRSVSAPLPEALYQLASSTFSSSTVEIYGMTESAGVITSNPLQPEKQKVGSVGISAGPSLRIVAENGELLDPMQPGEIQIHGDSVMRGYFHESSQPIEHSEFDNGWLKTGDIGYLDKEGYLFLTGRLKDIINRGGEKISPSEIDKIALQHPLVKDTASFAIPHPDLGEDIAMALVIKPGDSFSEEDFRKYLKDKLAYFKIPRRIILVDEIPRRSGKLQRWNLLEQLQTRVTSPPHRSSPQHSPEEHLSKELAELWAQVLEIEEIGLDDDFFYMGGNSLLATVLVNQMQEKWGVPLIVSTIYDAPVLRDFEQYLKDNYPTLIERIMSIHKK
jgi:acyl-CoA synthetase (AMP-forming)/AMP-acid ligase II